jgi:hypothetical protein
MRSYPSGYASRLKAGLFATAAVVTVGACAPATAEEGWKPFAEIDAARAKRGTPADTRPILPNMNGPAGPQSGGQPGQPPGGTQSETPAPVNGGGYVNAGPAAARKDAPPLAGPGSKIERQELDPALADGGASAGGLPMELWQGLDIAAIEQYFAKLEIPPRSPAMHGLWRRLLLTEATPPAASAAQFNALRAEGLYRSGLIRDQAELLAKLGGGDDPVLGALKARADIAAGRRETGCDAAKAASAKKEALPKKLKGDVIVLAGYCAAAAGNPGAAGLAAELAREEGVDQALTLSLLETIAQGAAAAGAAAKSKPAALPKRFDAVDARLMQLIGPDTLTVAHVERADPAALAVIASEQTGDPKVRLAAAEAAARLNAIDADQLAETYRAMVFPAPELGDALASKADPAMRRALLFKAAEVERTQLKKVRVIRALLDDGRRIGIYQPLLRALAPSVESLPRVSEIGWFAETAIESMLAAGKFDAARQWLTFAGGVDRPGSAPLQHWAALVDIADPLVKTAPGQSMASLENLAERARFTPDTLHRLATVLDAIDANVPIPLWDAANKAPQPAGGYLPETGVLAQLQDAAKKKEFGRTVLLALRTIGPQGAEGAQLIALGDAIRALKRAGLEPEARRVGFEALFATWPRAAAS